MSKAPFFADADAMAGQYIAGRDAGVFLFCLALIFLANIILHFGDKFEGFFPKSLAALWLIGVPAAIAAWVKRVVGRHADELLKFQYIAETASQGSACVVLVLIWFLWGRWISVNSGSEGGVVGDLIVTAVPYFILWGIYIAVRKKMRTFQE